jgi:hypothetical protein
VAVEVDHPPHCERQQRQFDPTGGGKVNQREGSRRGEVPEQTPTHGQVLPVIEQRHKH